MEIFPNTALKLLKRAPVDKKYENVMLFKNAAQQQEVFSEYEAKHFGVLTYQRHSENAVTVQASIGEIYDCNYMMFKNSNFENKWFYAFVDYVEYVNNVTCRVYYTIDVMQTWMFDYTLASCYVEREHSETDSPGDNIVAESFATSEYEFSDQRVFSANGLTPADMCVVILVRNNLWDQLVADDPAVAEFVKTPGLYSGVYQGLVFIAVPRMAENIAAIEALAKRVDFATAGGVAGAFMCPYVFLPKSNNNTTSTPGKFENIGIQMDVPSVSSMVGYTPRNKKLLTYPYTCLSVSVGGTAKQDYAYEYFANGEPKFVLEGALSSSPSAMVYAKNYLGKPIYLDGAVCFDEYPICGWSMDNLTEWVNNELFKTLGNAAVAAAGAMAGVPIPPPAEIPRNASKSDAYLITRASNQRIQAAQERQQRAGIESASRSIAHSAMHSVVPRAGIANNGGARGGVLFGNFYGPQFFVHKKCILRDYAKTIDSYFDRFGYATKKVKYPNIRSRRYWNYIQTIGCITIGTLPTDVEDKIRDIYDAGVTFWHDPVHFEDYSLAAQNTPISVG